MEHVRHLYTYCVIRELTLPHSLAPWIRTQRGRHGEHDNSDSMTVGIVAFAGTSLTSSTYWSVKFHLTFFNELSELNEMIVSISCIEVIIGRPVIRSHYLTRKIPLYFDEVESRCQSNQEAWPVSTPVCSAFHSCAHPRCQQSHAKQMGIGVGEDSIWMTRSDQSPDPLNQS